MLSKQDFINKQMIFINSDEFRNIYLANNNLIIKQDEKIIQQISCARIFVIFVVGDCTWTTKIIDELLNYNITIVFLNYALKPKFVINNQLAGNFLLREQQYGSDYDIYIARWIVNNKCQNQLSLLKSIRSKSDKVRQSIWYISSQITSISQCTNDESLRWIEGNIAKNFFSAYFEDQWWYARMPRTRIDILNMMLDIWYTYLFNIVDACLGLWWFDIYRWVYHKAWYQRKSLVCDIMEPFRCIIDHALQKAYNLWQIDEKDFKINNGEYTLTREKRNVYTKVFLEALMNHKEDIYVYTRQYYLMIIQKDFMKLPTFYIDKIDNKW